ncbi:type II toxin-antitoxin system HicB family antitoxin [uncultured Mailhella sp.]|uniref:type II toxin-antitoxin system HicB family antitoxin n=1 Tax=uncultured Mailhella sp. TaxID=1981031 RepID=UPI00344BE1A4
MTELPPPSPLAKVMDSEAAQGGWVMPADIDPSFLNAKAVRVNLSIPEYLLVRIDKKAQANGMSRSAYMVQAALA